MMLPGLSSTIRDLSSLRQATRALLLSEFLVSLFLPSPPPRLSFESIAWEKFADQGLADKGMVFLEVHEPIRNLFLLVLFYPFQVDPLVPMCRSVPATTTFCTMPRHPTPSRYHISCLNAVTVTRKTIQRMICVIKWLEIRPILFTIDHIRKWSTSRPGPARAY